MNCRKVRLDLQCESIKVAPPPKKKNFFTIFLLCLSVFIANIYPQVFTNFGQAILLFNKMALIFLEVLIILKV